MNISSKAFIAGLACLFVYAVIDRKLHPLPPAPALAVAPATSTPPDNSFYRELQAERAVREMLKDPDSARFRQVRVRGSVVCGMVNSKNSFGGMAGSQRFISRPGVLTVLEENVEHDTMQDLWTRTC